MTGAEAAARARALDFRRIGGRWRGRCPACGHNTCTLADGRAGLLAWCWHPGCDRNALLARLRELGVLPSRELTAAERRKWAEEKRKREEALAFAGAARLLADCALEGLNHVDDRRADLVALQQRLRLDPAGEYAWWAAHQPVLTAALVAAWNRRERRMRARAWQFVRKAAEVGSDG